MKCSVRIVLAAVLSSCALASIHGAPKAVQRRSPVSLEELAQQGAAALNGRRLGDFRQLTGPGVDTSWSRNLPPEADATNPWVGGTLGLNGEHWVVFSLDKMVEMDHDHLYRAEQRGGRWLLTASVDEAEPGRHWRIAGHEEHVSIDPQSRTARFTDTFSVRALGQGWPLIRRCPVLGGLAAGHRLPAGALAYHDRDAGGLGKPRAGRSGGDAAAGGADRPHLCKPRPGLLHHGGRRAVYGEAAHRARLSAGDLPNDLSSLVSGKCGSYAARGRGSRAGVPRRRRR
jgi:hypothetical protein